MKRSMIVAYTLFLFILAFLMASVFDRNPSRFSFSNEEVYLEYLETTDGTRYHPGDTLPFGISFLELVLEPESFTGYSDAFGFIARHAGVEVLRDGQVIYSYAGSGRGAYGYDMTHIIQLGRQSFGSLLLRLYYEDFSACNIVPHIYVGQASTVERSVYGGAMDYYLLFIIPLFSSAAIAFLILFFTKEPDIRKALWTVVVFCLMHSLFYFSRSFLYRLLGCGPFFSEYVQLFQLYVLPFLLTCYFYTHHEVSQDDRTIRIFFYSSALYTSCFILLAALDVLKLVPIRLISEFPGLLLSFLLIVLLDFYSCLMYLRHKLSCRLFIASCTCYCISYVLYLLSFFGIMHIRDDLASIIPFIASMLLVIKSGKSFLTYAGGQGEKKNLLKLYRKDTLTGALTRNAYEEFIHDRYSCESMMAIVVVDVNDLKLVNDTRGHEEGNRIIKTVFYAIKRDFPGFEVYRTGGDEFVLFRSYPEVLDVERMISSFNSRILVEEGEGYLASVGYAIFNPAETTLERAIMLADMMMYQDKIRKKRRD